MANALCLVNPVAYSPLCFTTVMHNTGKCASSSDATACLCRLLARAPILVITSASARRDDKLGMLDESKPKQLFTQMPVMLMKAVPAEKEPKDNLYQCPVYLTERRFREEVFTAQLKTKAPWTHWTTAGVALLLDVF